MIMLYLNSIAWYLQSEILKIIENCNEYGCFQETSNNRGRRRRRKKRSKLLDQLDDPTLETPLDLPLRLRSHSLDSGAPLLPPPFPLLLGTQTVGVEEEDAEAAKRQDEVVAVSSKATASANVSSEILFKKLTRTMQANIYHCRKFE